MPLDLVGTKEIGDMLGVSRQRAQQLAQRADFPEPQSRISTGPIWLREDIERWAREDGRLR
jgi:hypothetical protein